MIDPKSAFDVSASALTLLDTLIKTTGEMRKAGKDPSIAAVIERMPAEAFSLSEQFEEEAKALRHSMTVSGINPETPVNNLEQSSLWWTNKQGRALHKFKPRVDAILAQLETFMDDIVAVAHCTGRDELIAASYERALERKRKLQSELNYDRPIGEIVEVLIRHAQELHVESAKLLGGKGK